MEKNIVIILGCICFGMVMAVLGIGIYQKGMCKRERGFWKNLLNNIANSADMVFLLYSPERKKTEFVSDSIRWMLGLDKDQIEKNVGALFETLNFPSGDFLVQQILAGGILLSERKEYTLMPVGAQTERHLIVRAFPCDDGKVFVMIQDNTEEQSASESVYLAAAVLEALRVEYDLSSGGGSEDGQNKGEKSPFVKPQQKLLHEGQEEAGKGENLYNDKHILLVEEGESDRNSTCEILKKTRVQVDVAANGEEAVSLFSKSREGYYDLVFMDVQMPVMDGNEATKRIRELERRDAKVVPIVAMTTYLFTDDIRSSLRAGVDTHIAKPLSRRKVLEVMQKYLSK